MLLLRQSIWLHCVFHYFDAVAFAISFIASSGCGYMAQPNKRLPNRRVRGKTLDLMLHPPFDVIAKRQVVPSGALSGDAAGILDGVFGELVKFFSTHPSPLTLSVERESIH